MNQRSDRPMFNFGEIWACLMFRLSDTKSVSDHRNEIGIRPEIGEGITHPEARHDLPLSAS
jgi:hypothetical protein